MSLQPRGLVSRSTAADSVSIKRKIMRTDPLRPIDVNDMRRQKQDIAITF